MTLREIINRLESLERRVNELEEEHRYPIYVVTPGTLRPEDFPKSRWLPLSFYDGWPAYDEPRGDGNT